VGMNGSDDTPSPLIAEGGDGPTSVGVLSERGKVILRFPEPKLWIAFDPAGARNVADAMTAEADRIQRLVTREERLHYAANRLRDMLITRATIMFTSMEQEGKKPAYIASHIIDAVLEAVTELASR